MKAIDKMIEERRGTIAWTNICMGQKIGEVVSSDYAVKDLTLRKQLRQAGFFTRMWTPEIIQFSKVNFSKISN